jgi:hypothetical protein
MIEVKPGTLATPVEIKKGELVATSSSGKKISIPLEQLPFKQYINVIKKIAGKVADEDSAYYYLFLSGDFAAASELAVPDEFKDEAKKYIVEYIKAKLKGASDQTKAELQRKYGRLDEYKEAGGK